MKNVSIEFNLPVSFLKEGKSFVAYTPTLDLDTTGITLKETQKNFVEAVNIFFEKLMKMGTTNEVLEELNWQRKKGKIS